MNRFTDQTVLITGAAGAIGTDLARGFAAEGANVAIGTRSSSMAKAEDIAASIGSAARAVELDVVDEAGWARGVQETEAAFGPITVLVNNAAHLVVGSVESTAPADWRTVIDTNLTGAYLGIRAVAPSMRRAGGGSIVNINSIAGLAATPGLASYGASKWALRGLTLTAAKELARDNIRVNSVHPGIVETPLAYDPASGQELVPVEAFAIPRRADGREITRFVMFVASSDAAFSTGSEFVADGGFLLGPVAA
jgi:3alpha(or 20beta)-hydroxysteroid dehydrogenase